MPEPHPDAQETASLCYAMAYFVLPHYVFKDKEKLIGQLSTSNKIGAFFFYVIACKMGGKEPDFSLLPSFALYGPAASTPCRSRTTSTSRTSGSVS